MDRFVDSVFDDFMIGFLFARASRARVKAKEFELAAQHLGGPQVYSGRPLRAAHAKHPILAGHFERRLKLLEEAFAALEVPQPVREHWLAHDRALRAEVTRGLDCEGRARQLPLA